MPSHPAKHICNSHKPTHEPKIAEELVCLPTLTMPTKKTKSFKTGKEMTELKIYIQTIDSLERPVGNWRCFLLLK